MKRRGGEQAPGVWKGGFAAVVVLGVLLATATPAFGLAEVTVVKAGPGAASGSVKSDPVGIDCGAKCGPTRFLKEVKLTAAAGPGFVFGGWSGVTCAGGAQSNPCELAADFANRTATASFIAPPERPGVETGVTGPGEEWYLHRLNGSVSPEGFPVSECFFEYGLTRSYGRTVPCEPEVGALGDGYSSAHVHAETIALEPSTEYHFRLVASNPGGVGQALDRVLVTPQAPLDNCANAARRAEQGVVALQLPACMAFEMVSPPSHFSQETREISAFSADPARGIQKENCAYSHSFPSRLARVEGRLSVSRCRRRPPGAVARPPARAGREASLSLSAPSRA